MMSADDYSGFTVHQQGTAASTTRDQMARVKNRAAVEVQKLSERLSAFGEKAKRVLTGQNQNGGRGNYANLSESLLSADGAAEDGPAENGANNQQQHSTYVAPETLSAMAGVGDVPSDAETMVQTTMLAREAAELLWETIAFQSGSEGKDDQMAAQTRDLVEKANLLSCQLRGLVRDLLQTGGGGTAEQETMLASALEAKDMLDSCLNEVQGTSADVAASAEGAPAPQQGAPQVQEQQSPNANGSEGKLDTIDALEPPPLIQLDEVAPAPTTQAPTSSTGLTAAGSPGGGSDPFAASPTIYDANFDALPPSKKN